MEIHYESSGNGEPLLLLHGFTGAGTNWRLIFDTPPSGYRLIAPDLRGHGYSTNPSQKFTHRQVAEDIYELLDKLGIQKFKAIGLSAGGNALLHMATQQPDRIEAMILVSAVPYFPEKARIFMRQMSAEGRSEEEWEQMRDWHKRGDDQIKALWKQGRAFADSYEDMNFTPPYLSIIKARTLVVHGDRDPLYPNELAVELHQAIAESYLWIVPNGGHGPIFGDMRDAFVKTALAFLDDNPHRSTL
jgi:pimeloyl-ACP methyl ester carboxylesterase